MDEVEEYFWSLAGQLSRDAVDARPPVALAPVELERRLNGGANPLAARYYRDVVARERVLPAGARILDFGCGNGRIATQLVGVLSDDQEYLGLDPDPEAIGWAQRTITPMAPNFVFERVDIRSKAYNPRGTIRGTEFRFPFDDGELDVVLMVSVMTHVDIATVQRYIQEAARTLDPVTGQFIATFFLLDPEVERSIAEGRAAYSLPWSLGPSRIQVAENPELAIAHPRSLVMSMLTDAGFAAVTVREGFWSGRAGTRPEDYQDLVVAERTPGGMPRMPEPAEADAPSDGQRAAIRTAASHLAELGLVSHDQVAAFMEWALEASVNAVRWRRDGLGLTVTRPDGRPEPVDMEDTELRRLGFDRHVPHAPTAPGAFAPFDGNDMISVLTAAVPIATTSAVLACALEIAGNGIRMLTASRPASSARVHGGG